MKNIPDPIELLNVRLRLMHDRPQLIHPFRSCTCPQTALMVFQ